MNSIKQILIKNTWQENLNTWIFLDTVIQIKSYAQQDNIRMIDYAIEQSFDGRFILKTNREIFGDFYVELNYKNALPRLILSSKIPGGKFLELHACNTFTNEQKSLIQNRLNSLHDTFENKNQAPEKKTAAVNRSESAKVEANPDLLNIGSEVERLITIVQATMNVASDFQAYFEQIDTDISKLESKINGVNPTPFKPIR